MSEDEDALEKGSIKAFRSRSGSRSRIEEKKNSRKNSEMRSPGEKRMAPIKETEEEEEEMNSTHRKRIKTNN